MALSRTIRTPAVATTSAKKKSMLEVATVSDRPDKARRKLREAEEDTERPRKRRRDLEGEIPSKKPLALPPPKRTVPEEAASDDVDEEPSGQRTVRLLPGVRKSSLRRLTTMFGQRSDDIIDLLELDNADGALSLISKTLLQTLIDVLPVIERNVRRTKGQRGVYQLNQVISQVREMCHDIQAYKDKSRMGTLLVERHIRPAFLDIAVQITAAFAELEGASRNRMSKTDFEDYRDNSLNLMKRNIASYMSQQYDSVADGVVKSFN
jgi:hypothetical protein